MSKVLQKFVKGLNLGLFYLLSKVQDYIFSKNGGHNKRVVSHLDNLVENSKCYTHYVLSRSFALLHMANRTAIQNSGYGVVCV